MKKTPASRWPALVLLTLATAAPATAQGLARSVGEPSTTSAPPPAGAIESILAPFRDPRVSGRRVAAPGRELQVGAGRYTFSEGWLWELKSRDGKAEGYLFEGKGRLTWKVDDPAAQRVFAGNASRVGGVDVEGDAGGAGAIRASFATAIFSFSTKAAPALEGSLEETSAPRPASLEKTRERFADDRGFPASEIALAAADREGRPWSQALVVAGKDLRHEVDDLFEARESLWVLEAVSGRPSGYPKWRTPRVLGTREIGRTYRERPVPPFVLSELDADVTEVGGAYGSFRVSETVVPTRPTSHLLLRLRSDEVVGRTFDVLKTRVRSVASPDGTPVTFAHDNGSLFLFLDRPVPAGQPLRLTFVYEGPFFGRYGGDNMWELELATAWYPQPVDVHAAARFTWHGVVRARRPFLPFASGETVRRAEEKEHNLVEVRLARTVPFVTALAGNYTVHEETKDGVTARVASYGMDKPKSAAKLLALFHAFRAFYEPYFGPFPWKEFDIVEVNSYGFGQAPPGMMRITQEAFQSNVYSDPWAQLFSGGINERFAHEIAHSYWGYVVWPAGRRHEWLSEAFAEYAAGRAIEALKSEGEFKGLVNRWREQSRDGSGTAPILFASDISTAVNSGDWQLYQDRVRLLYGKGPYLLHLLRRELGDDAFFTVLKSFLRSFEKRQLVTTDDFAGLLGHFTKKDWSPWLEKYYYGFEKP